VLRARAPSREEAPGLGDGGVKHPRDVGSYLAAGASRVWSLDAGRNFESPATCARIAKAALQGELRMASARAVGDRTPSSTTSSAPRSLSSRRHLHLARLRAAGYESVGAILLDMITGVQSAFTYVGAIDPDAFHRASGVGVQTASGFAKENRSARWSGLILLGFQCFSPECLRSTK